jgi:hypothetical protein
LALLPLWLRKLVENDDLRRAQKHVETRITQWVTPEAADAFLFAQVFAIAPALFEEWKVDTLQELRDALRAATRRQRRSNLRTLVLKHCELVSIATQYREASNLEKEVIRRNWLAHIETAAGIEAEAAIMLARSELSVLLLREVEDRLYWRSRGDHYLTAYRLAYGLALPMLIECVAAKERGEDVTLQSLPVEIAHQFAKQIRREPSREIASRVRRTTRHSYRQRKRRKPEKAPRPPSRRDGGSAASDVAFG